MKYNSILEAVGNTPLVQIPHLTPSIEGVRIWVKLEGVNPTGSVKDRIALAMVEAGEESGELTPDKTILEPTSGNTGIALALVARMRGYKFTAVMPDNASKERIDLIEAYGAEIVYSEGAKGTNGSVALAQDLARRPHFFMPFQYGNPANVNAHYKGTGPEIIRDLPGVRAFVAGLGTGGTLIKADAVATEARLADLESDAQEIAAAVEDERDQVAGIKDDLVDRRDAYASVRDERNQALAGVRSERHDLEGDLDILQEEQARISARLAGASPGTIGPVRPGSSGLIWPVNGPIVSGFGMRWGRLHAGVDIAVPSGTAVRAPASGTVAIAGVVGGYGNYVCVSHTGGLSTCSAHNTSLGVSVGQRVSQGQVIASSGCTGHCFGPHVHFETRVGGTPVDPMGYL